MSQARSERQRQRKQQADQRGTEQQGRGTQGLGSLAGCRGAMANRQIRGFCTVLRASDRTAGKARLFPGSGLSACICAETRRRAQLEVSSEPEPVDLALMIALWTSLGLLFATHVALSFGLARLGPWHRGLVAFVVPPLAPFWGYHEKCTRALWSG